MSKDNIYYMTREQKQKLLDRLDNIVYNLIDKQTDVCWIQDIQDVLRALRNYQAGSERENKWAKESDVFKRYRLIWTWHYMSMDLSI